MNVIDVNMWHEWQENLKKILSLPDFSKLLSPKEVFIGFTDLTGRITYSGKSVQSKSKLNKEFNQLDYLIPIIANREYVRDIPSISLVLSGVQKDYLIVHPHENEEDDIDELSNLFDQIENMNDPIYGICILDSETSDMSHGIAYIAWKDENEEFHFAFYDPLSYRRKKKRQDGETYFVEYDYAKEVFEWIKEEADFEFQLHDLSKHCMFRNKDEFDCPQYHMNAEYCYFYSLHFLYTWVYLGKSTTRSGFKTAVENSYIIPMERISREYNEDTMKYKIILFSFVLTILSIYLNLLMKNNFYDISKIDLREDIEYLDLISTIWFELYGFPLRLNTTH
jgi:hypothetical protein